jgi:hypothetical protein
MGSKSGIYQAVYIKREDDLIQLKQDVMDFCERFIKPVHPKNWDWSKRDFDNEKNKPTVAEARAIRNIVFKDMQKRIPTTVDLSTINNGNAIKAFLNPKSKYEDFNMEEFAFALEVELEHGKLKAVNVTNNHPFLTAMIVLAHMSETLSYYRRLKVMELEGEIFEILRKLSRAKSNKDKWYRKLVEAEGELQEAKSELAERLEKMDEIPVMEEI